MKRLTFKTGIMFSACLGLLSACGAGDTTSSGQGVASQAKLLHRATKTVAADYQTAVQELYVSYFGRPADPTGLINFEAALAAADAPTDIQGLNAAYGTNASVYALINSFGTSNESVRLYGNGTTTDFVNAVFTNVLNRAPQASGLAFWVGAIDSGSLSLGDAALSIMAGALANNSSQGLLDADLIENRLNVASDFTARVTSQNAVTAYQGSAAAAIARSMLNGVDANTTVSTVEASFDATIASFPTALGFVFSPYKEVSTGGQASSGLMQSSVSGHAVPQTTAMPSRNATLTWAFAAGNCGTENWDGLDGATFASVNVAAFVNAGKSYIVSGGGYGQQFKCTSDAGFAQFMQRYYSSSMLGVDFDIEGGTTPDWTQSDVDSLVQRVIVAQKNYSNLRFSFTVGTNGGNGPGLASYGAMVMQSIANFGMKNYIINLMVMDYGPGADSSACVVVNGVCDMGASAVQAAVNLHTQYGVPYHQIELTPMIGENDSLSDIFTISDTATVSSFVNTNGLAGVHFWSFDRDVDCAFDPSGASAVCNGVGNAGTLGYADAFISGLGL